MKYELKPLPYPYNALEPYIDEATMKVHHDKHHQAYIDKLNSAIEGYKDIQSLDLRTILANLESVPEEIRQAVRNHGGGHYNHEFFWYILKKDVAPDGEIAAAIKKTFKSIDAFRERFTAAALGQFGSGWAWLAVNKDKQLEIIATPNQDTPVSQGKIPVLGIDVWEHAYYLKYQNRRAEYTDAFFNVIDWEQVNENYINALKGSK